MFNESIAIMSRVWADENFRHADASHLAHHDATVGTTGEHTTSGNGMTIDRCHHRLRMKKDLIVEAVQSRKKSADIVRATLAQTP